MHPEPAAPELARALDLAGYEWVAIGHADRVRREHLSGTWAAAIVVATQDADTAFRFCRAVRGPEIDVHPLLVLVTGAQLGELEHRDELFDDFCLWPFHPRELEARLAHLLWRRSGGSRPELVRHGPLTMNLETYQAVIDDRPLDLTYMEYELLKFLASHPGKVFTRETLLNRVWGYDYYGGARTVDVHVRRLRSKLGEEHAGLIQTVRSVGYSFGRARWVA